MNSDEQSRATLDIIARFYAQRVPEARTAIFEAAKELSRAFDKATAGDHKDLANIIAEVLP